MYQFDQSISEEDKNFFGFNDGTPMNNPNSSGMLNGKSNVMNYPCNENNKSAPYFDEYSMKKYGSE
jgi:hypothetical protein